jgi:excisionase family DNA binding protein
MCTVYEGITMKVYTIEEAADLLRIHPDTARDLARQGKLQGSKIGRRWRFTEQDLQDFLERQRPAVKEARP